MGSGPVLGCWNWVFRKQSFLTLCTDQFMNQLGLLSPLFHSHECSMLSLLFIAVFLSVLTIWGKKTCGWLATFVRNSGPDHHLFFLVLVCLKDKLYNNQPCNTIYIYIFFRILSRSCCCKHDWQNDPFFLHIDEAPVRFCFLLKNCHLMKKRKLHRKLFSLSPMKKRSIWYLLRPSTPLIYWQPDLIFLKKIHILIEKYAKLIKVIALFDTGVTASITKPIVLPSHLWEDTYRVVKTANNEAFVLKKISRPIIIKFFIDYSVTHGLLGSNLSRKDLLTRFDII